MGKAGASHQAPLTLRRLDRCERPAASHQKGPSSRPSCLATEASGPDVFGKPAGKEDRSETEIALAHSSFPARVSCCLNPRRSSTTRFESRPGWRPPFLRTNNPRLSPGVPSAQRGRVPRAASLLALSPSASPLSPAELPPPPPRPVASQEKPTTRSSVPSSLTVQGRSAALGRRRSSRE